MKLIFTLLICCFITSLSAQYSVGHVSTAFVDADRGDRSIACEIYYPSNTPGDNVNVASGEFPFVVFGHGFVMDYTAYQNITDALVAEGFILIYVETEGGFAPAHNEFGLDLAYLADHFFEENSNTSSIFQSHILNRCGIMGHSMGGGATWLAAAVSSEVDCIAGLAPAETNPSAIDAAGEVYVPAMVLSGSLDAVTPPETNHTPIYDASASACKYFVSILDGSHCGYATEGSLCDFGELFFAGLSREEQQVITHELLLAWFDVYLRDGWASNEVLQLYDDMQSNTSTTIECTVSVNEISGGKLTVSPNPGTDSFRLSWTSGFKPNALRITDLTGNMVMEILLTSTQQSATINAESLTAGVYLIHMPGMVPLRWVKQ